MIKSNLIFIVALLILAISCGKNPTNNTTDHQLLIKTNAIDHPFGSGRGKRIKSKIAKRNAPAGAKVGLIRPRRTGRKK